MHYSSRLVNFKRLRVCNCTVAVLGCWQLHRDAVSVCSPEQISAVLFGKVHVGSKFEGER